MLVSFYMILAFLGKGGSGKSTLSSLMANFLHKQQNKVLALDLDHNMDLSYNLTSGAEGTFPAFVSGDTKSFLTHASGSQDFDTIQGYFSKSQVRNHFELDASDQPHGRYTKVLKPGLSLMVAGPHNEDIKFGQKCSHSLSAPFKVFLPLLKRGKNEFVVVDEKAGSDGAGTGVCTGFDLAIVIAEPTVHSVKAARQIAELLSFFDTPHITVMNKVKDRALAEKMAADLPRPPLAYFSHDENPDAHDTNLQAILDFAKRIERVYGDTRLIRTQQKYQRNADFENNHHGHSH